MIALLRGRVASRGDGTIVVDVHGVGYLVHVPMNLEGGFVVGEEACLHIHTAVREDAITLFGFEATGHRDIFLALNKVKGIGPKLSLAIIGNTTIPELLTAVSNGDVKRLTHIPGLGKKTAARILVELKESFAQLLPEHVAVGEAVAAPKGAVFDDLTSALANLGYRSAAIESVLAQVQAESDGTESFDALFRDAMKLLR